eukprot:884372_1
MAATMPSLIVDKSVELHSSTHHVEMIPDQNGIISKDELLKDLLESMQGVYNGYGNSEKLRMHNLHCSHSHFMHQTNPCEYFAEYLYKAVKQMECADPDSEALCIEESSKIHELCGNGTCQQCALY